METFLQNLADILEVDEIKPTDRLEDFDEWDSLSILSVVAMTDSTYQVNLSTSEIKGAATAESLYHLIQSKKNN